MPTRERVITAADLIAMGDTGKRFELEQGVLLASEPPGATHGVVVASIAVVVWRHVVPAGLGVVLAGDAGFWLARSPDTVRAPDVAVVLAGRPEAVAPGWGYVEGPPDLAVEVRSQHDSPAALREKGLMWIARGCRLVWLADPHDRTLTVLAAGQEPLVLTTGDTLDGGDLIPGLSVPVAEIFAGLGG